MEVRCSSSDLARVIGLEMTTKTGAALVSGLQHIIERCEQMRMAPDVCRAMIEQVRQDYVNEGRVEGEAWEFLHTLDVNTI